MAERLRKREYPWWWWWCVAAMIAQTSLQCGIALNCVDEMPDVTCAEASVSASRKRVACLIRGANFPNPRFQHGARLPRKPGGMRFEVMTHSSFRVSKCDCMASGLFIRRLEMTAKKMITCSRSVDQPILRLGANHQQYRWIEICLYTQCITRISCRRSLDWSQSLKPPILYGWQVTAPWQRVVVEPGKSSL